MHNSDLFWAKVDKSGDCWLWTASTNRSGYGQFQTKQRVPRLAHRLSYEERFGPIPDGLQIDHKCHQHSCVNPSHLQAVTDRLNKQNLVGPRKDNKSGARGVTYDRRRGRYGARASLNGRRFWGGYHSTAAAAAVAARELRLQLMTNNIVDRQECAA